MLSLRIWFMRLLLAAMIVLVAPWVQAVDVDPQTTSAPAPAAPAVRTAEADPPITAAGTAENASNPVDKPKKTVDRDQPIHINAGRIEINQRKSLTTYTGKVSFIQGDLRFNAARAEAHYQGDKIDTIVAHGKPVTLHQRALDPQQAIHASAQRLEYHALENRIDLFGDVRLQQGDSVIQCATLHYNLLDGTLTAEGDAQDSPVSVVIEPKKIERPPALNTPPTTQKQKVK